MMSELKMFITGDFRPYERTTKIIKTNSNPRKIFGQLYDIQKKSDITITNLEGPLTNKESPINKIGSNFKISPYIANFLKESGFNLVTLANNHIYDQGQIGLEKTLEKLEKENIDYVGAGKTLEKSKKPFLYSKNNLDVSILNFTEVEFSCANENHGGANPMDIIDNVHQIQKIKENVDYVILIIHGGHEHHHYPSPKTRKRYRFLAENGADAIIAHHPHCISGYEIYEDVPIFYSLGNFLFPSKRNRPEYWHEGFGVVLNIKEEKIDFDIIPFEQFKNNKARIKIKSEKSDIYNKIKKISDDLDDDELLKSKFREYIEGKREEVFLGRMAGFRPSIIYGFRKLGIFKLLKYFMRKKDVMFIKQMITCQAHRETAIKILKDYLNY